MVRNSKTRFKALSLVLLSSKRSQFVLYLCLFHCIISYSEAKVTRELKTIFLTYEMNILREKIQKTENKFFTNYLNAIIIVPILMV